MKLLHFLCLWPLAAVAALDPKVGWDVAAYELTLPSDSASVSFYGTQGNGQQWSRSFAPQPGNTKLGYTYFKFANLNKWQEAEHPGDSGWYRLVEQGETRVWYDRKRDKQRQPEEIVAVPYRLWFGLRTMVYPLALGQPDVLADRVRPDGTCPLALRYAAEQLLKNQRNQPLLIPGLGDAAWLYSCGEGSNSMLELVVVRGPLVVKFEGWPLLLARTGQEFGDDPILRNVRGGCMRGDLTTYQIRPDNDGGYLDIAGIGERIAPGLREELLGMARGLVREWDRYCAVKVGTGPYFKGLYLDAGSLLPAPAVVPGSAQTHCNPNLWMSSLGLANAALPAAESLQLELRTYPAVSNSPTADQPLLNAAIGFNEDLAGYRKQTELRPEALTIAGADECVAYSATAGSSARPSCRTRLVFFRRGNVTGRVTHYCGFSQFEEKRLRPLPGDPAVALVKAVLALMAPNGGVAAQAPVPAGPGLLVATAAPDRLWSDGASTATLRFEATQADGRPAAGMALKLVVENSFVGDVATNELTTDKGGVATVEYRAGLRAGSNKVSAAGAEGLAASVVLGHGGLETAVRSSGLQFLADGATPVEVVARLLDPEGKAVASAVIEAEADERDLPASGELERRPKGADAREGWQTWAYTPPQIDPADGWKGGRVDLKFRAKRPGGGAALESPLALTLHSGSAFWVVLEKPGFAPGAQTSFRSERTHGSVTGTALAEGESGPAAVAGAKVTVYAAVAGKAQVIGSGVSGPDGAFTAPFTLEKRVAGPESLCPVEPEALALAPETQHWLEVVHTRAAALRSKGFASGTAESFAAKFTASLAAATDDPGNPRNAARLCVALRLMGEALGYLDELDDQHTQAEGWLNESLEGAVESMAKVIDLGSRVEAAQDSAVNYAAAAPELGEARSRAQAAWSGLRKRAVARFVTTAYGVMRDTYKNTSDELENREKLGLSNDSGTAEWKKWAVNKANDSYAEWMFSPAGALSTWGERRLKVELTKFLKKAYRGQYPKFFAAALEHAAGRIARGESTWAAPEKAAAVLREDFAPVAEAYRAANEAHLNRELARLDLKLAADTVGKGVAIYFAAKDVLISDPAEAKKRILESIDNADKAFAAVDTACQAYNGRQWFGVCHRARLAIAEVAVDASR
jgi:hypothetical protein